MVDIYYYSQSRKLNFTMLFFHALLGVKLVFADKYFLWQPNFNHIFVLIKK